MAITCPNCNRPQRKGARYCGYCGANLSPTAQAKSSSTASSATGLNQGQKPPKQKRFQTSQVVTGVAILLLFLVIISAVICRYWSEIGLLLRLFLS